MINSNNIIINIYRKHLTHLPNLSHTIYHGVAMLFFFFGGAHKTKTWNILWEWKQAFYDI